MDSYNDNLRDATCVTTRDRFIGLYWKFDIEQGRSAVMLLRMSSVLIREGAADLIFLVLYYCTVPASWVII